MINANLQLDKIYQGSYKDKDPDNFIFFKKIDDHTGCDVLTKERFNLSSLKIINFTINYGLFKYTKHRYLKDKNYKSTISENDHLNTSYLEIIRFFNLDDYNEIFENNPEIINKIILKLEKYTKRYLKEKTSIYIEQLKKYDSILDIFCILPIQLIEKIKPFWFDVIKRNIDANINFKLINIDVIEKCNKYDLKCYEVFNDNKDIIINLIENYKEKLENYPFLFLSGAANERIEESKKTLEVELEDAISKKDDDLILEIKIIQDELEKTNNNVFNDIKYNIDNNENYEDLIWWNELLYPAPDINIFKKNKQIIIEEIQELYELGYYYVEFYD